MMNDFIEVSDWEFKVGDMFDLVNDDGTTVPRTVTRVRTRKPSKLTVIDVDCEGDYSEGISASQDFCRAHGRNFRRLKTGNSPLRTFSVVVSLKALNETNAKEFLEAILVDSDLPARLEAKVL
jgi:hypothetical protein